MNYFFVVLYKLKSISLYNFSSKYILEILFFRDIIFVWGISAVGSAPHSHCGGHGFESRILPSETLDFTAFLSLKFVFMYQLCTTLDQITFKASATILISFCFWSSVVCT